MKITTDVNFAGSRPAGDALTRISASRGSNSAEAERAFAENFAAKLQMDRAIVDALAIAQTSRQIIQKAMDASSRLRAIASEAMTTGRINMDDLNVEVAGIQGVLAESGMSISIPVDRSSPAGDQPVEVIQKSFQKLGTAANDMLAGKRVNPEVFTGIEGDLKPAAAEADARIKSYASQFGGLKVPGGNADYVMINSLTAGLISGNPSGGMEAQGNLGSDITRLLTMA